MHQPTVTLRYICKGESHVQYFVGELNNEDVKVVSSWQDNTYRLVLTAKQPLTVTRLSMSAAIHPKIGDKLFFNGYQSWTDSRERSIKGRIRTLTPLAKALNSKYHLSQYGDYNFVSTDRKRGHLHGFTYAYLRRGLRYHLLASLNEDTGFTVFKYDNDRHIITVEKDCSGLQLKADVPYEGFAVALLNGSETAVFDRWFTLMNIQPPRVQPKTGYTSWYQHYQNISEAIIKENLNAMAHSATKFDIFQIDDGFQTAVGDWLSIDGNKFPNGMKPMADAIKEAGMMPGLWLAPFVCETTSEIYRNHFDWLLKDENGDAVSAGCNWSGSWALDIYNPQVQSYLRKVFDVVLNQWGFELVKLDFLYAACILPRKDKTRGQVMAEGMDFLRDCVGDKLILGCGVPLGSAFGKVDYCRIGCDVGLDWNDKLYMRMMHRERVSTKYAIYNTIYRRQLNGRAFLNDPDVFFLRDERLSLTTGQKTALSTVNGLFGSLLFTSDNVGLYNAQKAQAIQDIFALKKAENIRVEKVGNVLHITWTQSQKIHKCIIDMKTGFCTGL
ncbi:MAG: alpha-galactosidase [Oscillospiraceae bacterium]|nr:alpha-galactosidase [Oscillospiraceae bacterium]